MRILDKDGNEHIFCDFCGKHQSHVQYLVAGCTTDESNEVFICDECTERAFEILQKMQKDAKRA